MKENIDKMRNIPDDYYISEDDFAELKKINDERTSTEKVMDYQNGYDDEFKKTCPNVTALEYLIVKSKITPKRMKNILDGTARTRIEEVYIISQVLAVPIKDILDIKQCTKN